MMSSELLNQAITETVGHLKEHDKKYWHSLRTWRAELNDNNDFFKQACLNDLSGEKELSLKLYAIFIDEHGALFKDAKFQLLCLRGHIARLKNHHSYIESLLALIGLPVSLWSMLEGEYLLVVLVIFISMVFQVVKVHLARRAGVVERVAEHLQYLIDQSSLE